MKEKINHILIFLWINLWFYCFSDYSFPYIIIVASLLANAVFFTVLDNDVSSELLHNNEKYITNKIQMMFSQNKIVNITPYVGLFMNIWSINYKLYYTISCSQWSTCSWKHLWDHGEQLFYCYTGVPTHTALYQ